MAVTLETGVGHTLGFVREDMDIPNAESDVAGNLGVAIFHYRNADTPVYAPPTRNGDPFTSMATLDSYAGMLQVERQIADVGAFPVLSSLGESGGGLRAVAGWLTFAGVNSAAPVAGAVGQTEYDAGGSWAAPALSPGGEVGDLNVSILALMGFDAGFGNASGATIVPASGSGRTLVFDRPFEATPGMNEPRLLVMVAPAGTPMVWDVSGAQPAYAHFAFTVKAEGAEVTEPRRRSAVVRTSRSAAHAERRRNASSVLSGNSVTPSSQPSDYFDARRPTVSFPKAVNPTVRFDP